MTQPTVQRVLLPFQSPEAFKPIPDEQTPDFGYIIEDKPKPADDPSPEGWRVLQASFAWAGETTPIAQTAYDPEMSGGVEQARKVTEMACQCFQKGMFRAMRGVNAFLFAGNMAQLVLHGETETKLS